jgi:hypothetical protein
VLSAQKTEVSGIVLDAENGDTLPFVNVYFVGTKIGTTTDFSGGFSIQTYYASDSLAASFVGYKTTKIKIKKDTKQEFVIKLESSTEALPEVTVRPTGNPAHPILENVIRNKKANNREKLDSYQYEVYNKLEFDINNMSEKFMNKKMFKKFDFIFDNIDTTREKDYLPVFITESLSDLYYKRNPKAEKEYIKASRVSGVSNKSVAQFTGDMYQQVNLYQNFVEIFGKNFISPIANQGLFSYRYYLQDSLFIDDNWCYEIQFLPRRKGEMTLTGTMWINDTTYAIKKIEGDISEGANINFVKDLKFKQTYTYVNNEAWMLQEDDLLVDFVIADKQMGFYGQKHASYKNIVVNKQKENYFYNGLEKITLLDSADKRSDTFWDTHRHDSLTENQKGIYHMIDTLSNLPIITSYVDVIQTLVSGYKVIGKFEIGPYNSLYNYNAVEEHRFRLGLRTSNDFSKKVEFSGFLAYGLGDEEFKYGVGTRFFITKQPRQLMQLVYKHDIEQIGLSSNAFSNNGALSNIGVRNPINRLVFNTDYRISYEREWLKGLSTTLLLRNNRIDPLGIITFQKRIPNTESFVPINDVTTSEVTLFTRFARNEEFLAGEFDRISLGTKFPTFTVNYTYGMKGVLNSGYEYHKLIFGYRHKLKLGFLGVLNYSGSIGKVFGSAPYPLLEVHQGNESWLGNTDAYNMMNILEFVSDEYVSGNIEHHFNGLFLNKVPLLKRLKWREVVGIKGIWGKMGDDNIAEMALPIYTSTLRAKPYFEASAGVENIFKFLRLDLLWRLNYLDNEFNGIKVNRLGLRGKFQFRF